VFIASYLYDYMIAIAIRIIAIVISYFQLIKTIAIAVSHTAKYKVVLCSYSQTI